MALTDEEVQAHAKRLIELHNDAYEFSQVYEDEELEDFDQEDWEAVLKKMYEAKVEVSFD